MNYDDKYYEKIFEHYETNFKNFQKVFAILIGMGLFFFFTAVFGYFSLQLEKKVIDEQINITKQKIEENRNNINNLENNILNVREKLDNLNQTLLNAIILNETTIPNQEKRLNEIRKNILNLEKVVINPINDSNLTLFRQLENDSQKTLNEQKNKVKIIVDDLKNKSSQENTNLLSLVTWYNNNKTNLAIYTTNYNDNITYQKGLVNKSDDLQSKWDKIQSPFGDLPIYFTDLLAMFPLSLAGGFLICIIFFVGTLIMRRSLNSLYRNNSSSGIIADQQIVRIAPLWLDPLNPEQNKSIYFLILLIPFIIFIITIGMLIYSWHIIGDEFFPASSEFNKIVYELLYILGFGMFSYCYWHIIVEMNCYSQKLPKQKFLIDKKIEENIYILVKNKKLTIEQCDSLMDKLMKAKRYLDEQIKEKAIQCLDEFIDELKSIKKISINEESIFSSVDKLKARILSV